MPKFVGTRHRHTRPPPPPPPLPPLPTPPQSSSVVPFAGPSYTPYFPGMLAPSSLADYLSNPNDFYSGASFSHKEHSTASRLVETRPEVTPVEEDQDNCVEVMTVEEEQDDPMCPQNSPVNKTVSDGTKAHIKRNDDVSHLLSEIRYPSRPSQTLGRSSSSGESSDVDNRLGQAQLTSRIIDAVTTRLIVSSRGEHQSVDTALRNWGARGEVAVRTEQVDSDSSSDSDDYWAASTLPATSTLDSRSYLSRNRSTLDSIDEAGERGKDEGSGEGWHVDEHDTPNDMGSQNALSDNIPGPAFAVTLEDVHNGRSWVYESSDEKGEAPRPPLDKGKGIDREAHPNYDGFVGYPLRRMNNDPGFEPGPSDWQHRPRIEDLYGDDEVD